MLSRQEASVICQLLEYATESNWPYIRDRMIEAGWTPGEIVDAWGKIADIAGVTTGVELGDF